MLSTSQFLRFIFLPIVMMLLFWGAVYAQEPPRPESDQNALLQSLKKLTGNCDRRASIVTLYTMGERAIPALIAHIDDTDIAQSSTLMLANPVLSYAPPGSQRDVFSGVIFAYVVELILARGTINGSEGHCEFLLNIRDYVYGQGLIMKAGKVIEASDLKDVKRAYSAWWEANKKKNLSQLRQEWAKSVRPLSNSQYSWY